MVALLLLVLRWVNMTQKFRYIHTLDYLSLAILHIPSSGPAENLYVDFGFCRAFERVGEIFYNILAYIISC